MKNFRILILLFFVMLTAITGCKKTTSEEENVVEEENISQYVVDIEAIDYAFIMQSELKSGWVTFDFQNKGHKMHFGMLLKFNSHIDQEDMNRYLADRTEENFGKLVGEEGLTLVGGPGFHTQGQKSEMTIYLAPGDYLMTCNTRTVDGIPHYELGMEKFFRVAEESSGAEAPENIDLKLSLKKYFIEAEGELRSGRQTIAVDHVGGDSFDVHLVKLNDTSNISSTLEFMDDLTSPSKSIFSGGAEQKEVDHKSFITIDFTPGDYMWVSHEFGAMGMIKKFTIPEQGNSTSFDMQEGNPNQVNIDLAEGGFNLPSIIEAGRTIFLLKNNEDVDEQHVIRMFRMEEGRTIKGFLQYLKERERAKQNGNMKFEMENPTSGYYVSFEENDSTRVKKLELNLNPGTYGVVCFHAGEDENYDHIFKGEATGFEVKKNH